MITSSFNDKSQILETIFSGDIYAEEILDYMLDLKENKSYPRQLKSLTNTTLSEFKFSFKDLNSFINAKKEALVNYETIIMAFIIDNSSAAAISTLYQQAMANNEKYKFKIFSSHEAALFWLNSFTITD